jgi:hypothetical protein
MHAGGALTGGERAMRLAAIRARAKVLRSRIQRSVAARRRWEERQRELGLADEEETVDGAPDALLDGLPENI